MQIKVNPHIGVPLEQYLKDNIGLIYHVTRRYRGFDHDDLFQEGAIQFMECYTRYDGSSKFASYAIKSINGHILKYIKKSRVLKVPAGVDDVHDTARIHGLDEGDIDKLVELTGKKRSYVEEAMLNFDKGKVLWIDAEIDSQENGRYTDYHNVAHTNDDYIDTHIHDFINTLNDKDRQVVYMFAYDYTLKEIGDSLGVTKQAVQARHRKINRLAKMFFGDTREKLAI